MIDITDASERQVYDMTYRLANQRMRIRLMDGRALTGTLWRSVWRGSEKGLHFSPDNEPGSRQIAYHTIASIKLGV